MKKHYLFCSSAFYYESNPSKKKKSYSSAHSIWSIVPNKQKN